MMLLVRHCSTHFLTFNPHKYLYRAENGGGEIEMSIKLPKVTQPLEREPGFELRQSDSRVHV